MFKNTMLDLNGTLSLVRMDLSKLDLQVDHVLKDTQQKMNTIANDVTRLNNRLDTMNRSIDAIHSQLAAMNRKEQNA